MKRVSAILLAAPALALSACGQGGNEPEGPVDTSYEQSLPSPVQQSESDTAPVPDNTSIVGGPDEQVDAIVSGEAPPVRQDARSAAPAPQ